jgi:hypothetical protein
LCTLELKEKIAQHYKEGEREEGKWVVGKQE